MTKQNLSERKKKLRKKTADPNAAQKNPPEAASKKLSRDAVKKQRNKVEMVVTPEKKPPRFTVNALMMKIILLFTTAAGIAAIVFFDPNTTGREVLRGVGIAGLPIAVFLLTEGYYHTASRARYTGRLLLWGFLAQIPMLILITFDNVRNQNLRDNFSEMTEAEQAEFLFKFREVPLLNYLFTLLFALLFIWLVDSVNRLFRKGAKSMASTFGLGVTIVMILVFGIVFGVAMQMYKLLEAPLLALMLVFAFVLMRERKEVAALMTGFLGLMYGITSGPETGKLFYAIGASLPAILIVLYDGSLGYSKEKRPYLKYGFYIAYAVTISCLVMLGMFLYAQTHTPN